MNVLSNTEIQEPNHSDKHHPVGGQLEDVHRAEPGRKTQSQESGGYRSDGQERDVHCRPAGINGLGKGLQLGCASEPVPAPTPCCVMWTTMCLEPSSTMNKPQLNAIPPNPNRKAVSARLPSRPTSRTSASKPYASIRIARMNSNVIAWVMFALSDMAAIAPWKWVGPPSQSGHPRGRAGMRKA